MIESRRLPLPGIGSFFIPDDTEAHRRDSEKCITSICGFQNAELAAREGAWGDRCGQEYSYRPRGRVEDVRTVLDIGHNVGGFIVWAGYWWPETLRTIHAYDPNPGCAEFARLNAKLLRPDIDVQIHTVAVTADPAPKFYEDQCWGRSWTDQRMAGHPDNRPAFPGVPVPPLHPRDLPAADAMKLDAEGVEGEIVAHYRHWAGVKVLMAEWHGHDNRRAMFDLAAREGLELRKNDCGQDYQGVACWVRP